MRALWLLLVLALPAQAAINGSSPFYEEYGFNKDVGGDATTVVSGALDARLVGVTGAFGLFDTRGVVVSGLDRVCWISQGSEACAVGDLAVHVLDGGSVGLDLAGTADATYTADHALALFMEYDDEDLNSLDISKTLTAAAVGGELTFTKVPRPSALFGTGRGGLTGLDDDTDLQLWEDGALRQDFSGKSVVFRFEGSPRITPVRADFVVLPFEDGSRATFAPASAEAADIGLRFQRVTQVFQDVEAASADGGSQRQAAPDLGDLQTVLTDVMRGALLRLPPDTTDLARDFAFIRFDSMLVRGLGDDLRWSGTAHLQIQDGQVVGAPKLIGPGLFGLPWWSILLWCLALGVWVTRIVVKPEKENPRWDPYKWVGWVAGPLAFILLFFLWDLEVRAVWGASILTTRAVGQGLLATALVQVLPLLYVLFAVAAPLRIGLRNGLLLARQGTFMGLSGAVAYVLSYFLGATLLLAYLDIVLKQVLEQTGG